MNAKHGGTQILKAACQPDCSEALPTMTSRELELLTHHSEKYRSAWETEGGSLGNEHMFQGYDKGGSSRRSRSHEPFLFCEEMSVCFLIEISLKEVVRGWSEGQEAISSL